MLFTHLSSMPLAESFPTCFSVMVFVMIDGSVVDVRGRLALVACFGRPSLSFCFINHSGLLWPGLFLKFSSVGQYGSFWA